MREQPVLGCFLKLPRPEVVELLALAGYDFAICDLEHAQIDEAGARSVVLAGRATGLPIVVRPATPDRGLINRLLEAGAAGIQLPRVRTRRDADGLRDLLAYPPVGSRSISQAQPAAGFGAEPLPAYLTRSNDSVLGIGQFETADLADPLDDAVAPLDVAFLGTVDLSVDVGRPGDPSAPEVRERIGVVERACARTGTILGTYAGTVPAARAAAAAGYRYIALGADVSTFRDAASAMVSAFREPRE
ncbi:MAG: HpcH/HpaI aldolase family protein [Micromonosporaceae bacterium]